MHTSRLLLNAEAFGFGPSSAIADFFLLLRQKFHYIAFIGKKHTLDLQKHLSFDAIYDLEDADVQQNLNQIICDHALFMTASDFNMAEQVVNLGVTTIIYDPIAWFWSCLPEFLNKNNVFYIAQNFFGVEERLEKEKTRIANMRIVPPIVPRIKAERKENIGLINLGGIGNPLWSHEEDVFYAKLIIEALRKILPANELVIFATSKKIVDSLNDPQVKTYERSFISSLLPQLKYAIMTPGLGNIYDAARHNIPTLFIPPANDSQGIQLQLIHAHGMTDEAIQWSDIFSDEEEYVYGSDQNNNLQFISDSIHRVRNNAQLNQKFVELCRTAFHRLQQLNQSNTAAVIERFGCGGCEEVVNIVDSIATQIEQTAQESHCMTETHFSLAGNKSAIFSNDSAIKLTEEQVTLLKAHLPGIQLSHAPISSPDIRIEHYEQPEVKLSQQGSRVKFHDAWHNKISPDFVHLFYGAARLAWLNDDILPIHAACVGTEEGGILLVGHPGVGKSSITLHAALNRNLNVFSGDKTLIKIDEHGNMWAIGGTTISTIRTSDFTRWPILQDYPGIKTHDRFSFEFKPEQMIKTSKLAIKKIVLVQLNDGVDKHERLTEISALHTLYPYFVDTERADVILSKGKAMFSGTISDVRRQALITQLTNSLEKVPTFNIIGSLDKVTDQIVELIQPSVLLEEKQTPSPKKIIFGICGIGNGHTFRQLPIVEYFAQKNNQILVFAYGDSLQFYNAFSVKYPNVTVAQVANPYYKGNAVGVDFSASAMLEFNQQAFTKINLAAMAAAQQFMGRPDLIISDYEETSAKYAYAQHAPLVTLDQQSKYLIGDFVNPLHGQSYLDEVSRLNLLFPKADKRLACSFFNVQRKKPASYQVELMPPVLRDSIITMQRMPEQDKPLIIVYLTAQEGFEQPLHEIPLILSTQPHADFHVFLPKNLQNMPINTSNVSFYHAGNPTFEEYLKRCNGIISTAGHTLLSEAMYLGVPVYAMPLPLYEQQMNAAAIGDAQFGINHPTLTAEKLCEFITRLPEFTNAISQDNKVLLRGVGQEKIISTLNEILDQHHSISSHRI
jgi:uncharacterized protein (TIGR00661 family)